jgi:hypothetical protein
MSLESITKQVKAEIAKLNQVLHLLGDGAEQKATKQAKTTGPKRKLSAAGRRRIAAAQRARWAKIRAGKK